MKAIRRRDTFSRVRSSVDRTIQDTRLEIRKVSWPSRDETIRLTIVVIVLSLSMAIFLGVIVDGIFFKLYQLLLGL